MYAEGRKPKKPRKLTENKLRNAALRYISRYPGSTARLRRALERQVMRAERRGDLKYPEAPAWIDKIVEDCVGWGYLDDQKYATAYARSQVRKGRGVRAIRSRLRERGVESSQIEEAIAALPNDADWIAVCRVVRRRRFGAYRKDELVGNEAREKRQKELAALGRAGFSYTLAKRALDADRDTMDDLLR